MTAYIEQLIAGVWNYIWSGSWKTAPSDLILGRKVQDGQIGKSLVRIPQAKRSEHMAILGKTGSGKSSLLKQCVLQDLRADRGFVFFDLHGDAQEFLLSSIAEEEALRQCDLSQRLVVIEPGDSECSVGLNVVESQNGQQSFVQISECARILKSRWGLDQLGARTEELLRNALFVLMENQLTLVELPLLLTHTSFRSGCLKKVSNPEVRSYFEGRYDMLSDAMQQTFREAVLNKTTVFTADPQFRHIVGQPHSSFSLVEAMDSGFWILLNLDKGRLGEQAATLGSLFLSKLKNAVFARRTRKLFTLYCDELQNLASLDTGLDTLFSEARKFGISVCSANQYLSQYPPAMQSAILAAGTQILFQLASDDANRMAAALGGGKQLSELLRYLPHREIVVKSAHHRWVHAVVPEVSKPKADGHDLYRRCRQRWAKPRALIERDIRARAATAVEVQEVLHDWD